MIYHVIGPKKVCVQVSVLCPSLAAAVESVQVLTL